MWKIFQEEFYKIASGKAVWIGLFLLLVFVRFRLGTIQKEYGVTVDGQNFYGAEAIQKDKEIAAQYAGPLTEEKMQQIYERYGFYYYDPEKDGFVGNFCNKFITERMTNFNWTNGTIEEIQFYEGEEWENNAAPYLKGNYQFDYIEGWADLQETYGMIVIEGLAILFIIALSPVFAEEYTLKTADILLTTRRGKNGGIWMKAAAALCFVLIIYCAVTLYVWGIYLKVFGTQGLSASPVFIGVYHNHGAYFPSTISHFFLMVFGLGLAGFLLLTCMALAASALCKNAFMAVVVSLALFFVPLVWLKILGPMRIFGITVTKEVTHFMVSMPFYLPLTWGFAFTGRQIVIHLAIAVLVGAAGMALGYRKYRDYQG